MRRRRRIEVRGQHPDVLVGELVENLATRGGRHREIHAERAMPCRIGDLDRVMETITGQQRLALLALDVDAHMAR